MASHVVVIDSAARRTMIKTTPNKHLSDVLEEACTKLGLKSSQYGLRNNNKAVDLSRTFRLSGLSSGAKLELVQLSKSAGVVSVALQLPESDALGAPNARLTDKFPSTTTLWLILRKFEAGVAGGGGLGGVGTVRNLTAKAAPAPGQGKSGSGRLYYQQPVIHVLNRELASFTDLQKSLAQLGLNSGSALMRLSYRPSEQPLEEAMEQIQSYFDSTPAESKPAASTTTSSQPAVDSTSAQITAEATNKTNALISEPVLIDTSTTDQIPSSSQGQALSSQPEGQPEPENEPEPTLTLSNRPISVFRPPTSSTPLAALKKDNDSDYTPTVEHAQIHQKQLNQASRNIRLATDAELAAQQAAETEKLATIKEVEIKIRFPDESAVSSKFTQKDTAADLYAFVRNDCLDAQFQNEKFVLRNPGVRNSIQGAIPDDTRNKLIMGLQLRGRVLLVFAWDDSTASPAARGSKQILKPELRAQARDVKVPDIPGMSAEGGFDDDPGIKVKKDTSSSGGAGGGDGGGKKLPKWMSKLSKK